MTTEKRIIRVFPTKTAATPDDELVRINCGPAPNDEADEVHISVAFTWDLDRAESLAREWAPVAPVKIGGPATGDIGGAFTPGMYLKHGYTITSRGCPNTCWFCCEAGKAIIEIPIVEGVNHVTGNLLACSDRHVKAVFDSCNTAKHKFDMRLQFTGGLEAKRLQPWHVKALAYLRPKQLFMAYDTPDDLEPLRDAGSAFLNAGFSTAGHVLRAYVLVGWPRDTREAAEKRVRETIEAGFLPMAMVYRDRTGAKDPEWATWQRTKARPAIIAGEYDSFWRQNPKGGKKMVQRAKIVTYSMDPLTLQRLAILQDWMHEPMKSRILCQLIDKEYLRLAAQRAENEK